ncbi:probable protein ABIL3 [Phoenix dactylifera]|uniref:Probable protein ABIL3 n=1 Tax=Phoenix dactylifera TaxID=42345 RepID=A0A8B9AGP8_PHODC|nr:probable protein ABIL3 [Phoenix dactylifera]XP_038984966.1 probable protein ABIL3 [Phoenix dactylifera]XP_038984967.1 probable protein ABIL3 [Phoenix dactylifera]
METISPSPSSFSAHQEEAPAYDEISMKQSLLFSHSLKDLKNLRSQLYSAAEYFELSCSNDDQKRTAMNTLKDYALEALVNTVDHLGSVSYKVNDLLNEKVGEVSGTEFRVSCIEQRLRTCQEYIDQEGRSQQSLVIQAPKYHKHYILPVGETILESGRHAIPKYQELDPPKESQQFQTVVQSTIRGRKPSFRRLRSPSPSASSSPFQRARSLSPFQKARPPSPSLEIGKFSFKEKRAVSPPSNSNPSARTKSLSSRPNAANSSNIGHWYPSETRKSSPMHLHAETNGHKETDQNSKKSRGLLKALLTRRRSRNDESLYAYLNEY